MSTTIAKVVTARKRHVCHASRDSSWFRACSGWIEKGEKYVRMVAFPGDFNSSGVPWVMRACPGCGSGYTGPAGDISRELLAELTNQEEAHDAR